MMAAEWHSGKIKMVGGFPTILAAAVKPHSQVTNGLKKRAPRGPCWGASCLWVLAAATNTGVDVLLASTSCQLQLTF